MLHVVIEFITGTCVELDIPPKTRLADLKRMIAESEHIPVIKQSLVFKQTELKDEWSSIIELLSDTGWTLSEPVHLRLIPVARAGPLSSKSAESCAGSTSVTGEDRIHQNGENSSDLDLSLTEERRVLALQRAQNNVKTAARMQRLRQSLDRFYDKRDRQSGDCTLLSSKKDDVTTTEGNALSSRFNSTLSGPEDTSAKESSAGETELEESRWELNGEESDSADNCERLTSTNELDGAVAAESLQPQTSSVFPCYVSRAGGVQHATTDDEYDDEYLTPSEWDFGAATIEDTQSDPSELSSGMVVCDILRFRRPRVKRKSRCFGDNKSKREMEDVSAIPSLTSSTVLKSNNSNFCATQRSSNPRPVRRNPFYLDGKHSEEAFVDDASSTAESSAYADTGGRKLTLPSSRSVIAANKTRARSKPRLAAVGNSAGTPLLKVQIPSSGVESSSEQDDSQPECASKRSAIPSRRQDAAFQVAQRGRFASYLANASGRTRQRQPQSSQSQQRCATCGTRLAKSTTYQCRCGKTLCMKHRMAESHSCPHSSNADAKQRKL